MTTAVRIVLVAALGALALAQPAHGAQRDTTPPASPTTATLLGVVPPLRPLGANLIGAAATTPANLSYHGGPVMRTNTTYAIYWFPAGSSYSAGYQSTINTFFQNIAAASGATTNVYSLTPQYYDTTGHIANTSTWGGSVVDTHAFPTSGCTDPGSRPVCLSDTQLRAEIASVVAAQGWTPGPTKLFFLFTPRNVGSCYSSGFCAYTAFCAYHSAVGSGNSVLLYANQPYAGGVNGCDTGQHPNGDDADATINVASHEHNEAITDPQLNAWFDTASGNENGDNCAWTFGTPLGGTNGSYYNQIIGSGHYYLQREWSNATSSCLLLSSAGTATQFTVTAAASPLAGAATSVVVTARDNAGNVATSFRGAVTLTSSDSAATLPAAYTFTAADNGVHTFTTPVLRTAGSQTITATSGQATGSVTVTVNAGTISRFTITGPPSLGSGSAGSYVVTALNSAGLRLSGYRGTVRFTSSDTAAVLPANTTFTGDDAGAHTFSVTLRTAGARTVTVADTLTTAATGTATTTVAAAAATHFTVTAAATSLAGAALTTTVVARDDANNVATGFRGVVTLTSSDGAATLPTAYTFTATDNGTHAFTTPVLRTAGSQTVTATSGQSTGSATVTVSAGTISRFTVTGPATLASGASGSYVVTALNAAGYRLAGYRGTVHFTSSDTLAGLPADTAFTEDDAGAHTFTVTLRTAGARSVAVADRTTTSATGSAATTVAAGNVHHFTVTAAATSLAGAALTTTVVARDEAGNVANGFRGAVTLTSSDGAATLPTAYTFTATDNGTHAFTTPVLRTAGSQTVTATSGQATGSATVTVSAGTISRFTVSAPATSASGATATVTVTALNAAGSTLASYRGTAHLMSSDPAAVLPADTAFSADDAGVHVFTVTLRTAGARTISVRDTVATGATGTATTSVTAGTATALVVTSAATGTSGVAQTITVTARDAANNVAAGFRGTVHFTSSDGTATLPVDYAFQAADNGVHVFPTSVLRIAGSQMVTATSADLTASATVNVAPGALTHFTVTTGATAAAGTPVTVTVTGLDAANNTTTGYRGAIHFTSTDGTATLPADYTFQAADNGEHAFTVTLRAAGSQTVTVRATALTTLTGAATTTVTS